MSRQDANAAFARTSFLYGGNAAYIEDLYARYETDPKALDAAWQSFFQSLKDEPADVERNAQGRGKSVIPTLARNFDYAVNRAGLPHRPLLHCC